MKHNQNMISRVTRDLTNANLEELRRISAALVVMSGPDVAQTLLQTLTHFAESWIAETPTKEKLYRVRLVDNGPKKIAVIKELREFFGLALKEANELSSCTPVTIQQTMSSEVAAQLCKKLTNVGAHALVEEVDDN